MIRAECTLKRKKIHVASGLQSSTLTTYKHPSKKTFPERHCLICIPIRRSDSVGHIFYLPTADSHQEKSSKNVHFADENRKAINNKFANLLTNVQQKMSKMSIDIKEFLLFVIALFPPGECIPPSPTNLSNVFEAITRNGLWNYFHYSPLVRIVERFCANDPEMKAWIKNYKKDLKAYTIVASIEDFIESDLDTGPSREDSAKYDPRYNCPVEWKTDFVDHSLQHLANVWGIFSVNYLLPDSPPTALLDRVRKGCVCVTWLVPSYLIQQLVARAKMDTEFFRKFHILKMTVRGKTVYEETTDVSLIFRKYAHLVN